MKRSIGVAILGGTGFGAGELLRLLSRDEDCEIVSVTSTSASGSALADVHRHLRGFYDLRFDRELDWARLKEHETRVVFSALPHGASGRAVKELVRESLATHVIDLSGDLRLSDRTIHERFYPDSPFYSEMREAVVYGLPELLRERIRTANLIANPGCLATACILALLPLARKMSGAVSLTAQTGSTGSGRGLKESVHHATRHDDLVAYKVLAHQHEPEILQALGDPYGKVLRTSFVSQSLPLSRGIYVTAHTEMGSERDAAEAPEHFRSFYGTAPFVRVCATPPHLRDVVGTNFCDVHVAVRGRQIVVLAALDNLGKGMAGTAMQNMNLMLGRDEAAGLFEPSLGPS